MEDDEYLGEDQLFSSSMLLSLKLALEAGVSELLCLVLIVASVWVMARPMAVSFVASGHQVLRLTSALFTTVVRPAVLIVAAAAAAGILLSIHFLTVVLSAAFLLAFRLLILVSVAATLLVRFFAVILGVTIILGLTTNVLRIVRHALASWLLDFLPHPSLEAQHPTESTDGQSSVISKLPRLS